MDLQQPDLASVTTWLRKYTNSWKKLLERSNEEIGFYNINPTVPCTYRDVLIQLVKEQQVYWNSSVLVVFDEQAPKKIRLTIFPVEKSTKSPSRKRATPQKKTPQKLPMSPPAAMEQSPHGAQHQMNPQQERAPLTPRALQDHPSFARPQLPPPSPGQQLPSFTDAVAGLNMLNSPSAASPSRKRPSTSPSPAMERPSTSPSPSRQLLPQHMVNVAPPMLNSSVHHDANELMTVQDPFMADDMLQLKH